MGGLFWWLGVEGMIGAVVVLGFGSVENAFYHRERLLDREWYKVLTLREKEIKRGF